MKNRNLRSYAWLGDAGTRKLDAKARSIDVIASTDAEDSYGTVLEQDWQLERFKLNPVVFFEHNKAVGDGFFTAGGERPADKIPIAHAENVRVEGNTLKALFVFPGEGRSELADAVWRAIEDGRLSGVSVGFRPGKVEREELPGGRTRYRLKSNILHEISIVGLPSNPECVVERSMLERFVSDPTLLARLADGDAADTTTPQAATPATDPARTPRAAENRSMPILEILARMLGCTADEPSVIAAIEEVKRKAERPVVAELGTTLDTKSFDDERATLTEQVSKLQPRAAIAAVAITALGLAETAGEADVTKSISQLTARAAKADELEPKVKELDEAIARHETEVAEREIGFLLARGKDYGFSFDERSRKALAAYRKADPKGFAEDHKAALDGLRAFDRPELFGRVAGEGGKASTTVDEQAKRHTPVFGPSNANEALHHKADELQKAAAEKGAPLSRADALDLAARSL